MRSEIQLERSNLTANCATASKRAWLRAKPDTAQDGQKYICEPGGSQDRCIAVRGSCRRRLRYTASIGRSRRGRSNGVVRYVTCRRRRFDHKPRGRSIAHHNGCLIAQIRHKDCSDRRPRAERNATAQGHGLAAEHQFAIFIRLECDTCRCVDRMRYGGRGCDNRR